MTPEQKERFDALMKQKDLMQSGYGGLDRNGKIVDRREVPTAVPFQKNSMFGNPEPKDVIINPDQKP